MLVLTKRKETNIYEEGMTLKLDYAFVINKIQYKPLYQKHGRSGCDTWNKHSQDQKEKRHNPIH